MRTHSISQGADAGAADPPIVTSAAHAGWLPRIAIAAFGPIGVLVGAYAVLNATGAALLATSVGVLLAAVFIVQWWCLARSPAEASAATASGGGLEPVANRSLAPPKHQGLFGPRTTTSTRGERRAPTHRLDAALTRLSEARREAVEDRLWALSDHELRFRHVLDRQKDVISLRDPAGFLTFANVAFCDTFNVRLKDVVGTRFAPPIAAVTGSAVPTDGGPQPTFGASKTTSQVMTRNGPRWFEWHVTTVPGEVPEWDDVQTVGRDITDERAFAAALAAARDAAEAANQAKSRFLAAMSHEVRTPLNGIVGLTDALSRTSLDHRQRAFVTNLKSSAETLRALIDDILDFSQIEAGRVQLRPVAVDLDALISNVVSGLQQKANDKGLTILTDLSLRGQAKITGDPLRLRQILTNLIDNAIKFTEAGEIVVAARVAQQVRITVTDTGPGFGIADPERLFSEFEQAPGVADHARDGTDGVGLGLAICARLVDLMGGQISARTALGGGACVTVSLPLGDAGPANAIRHDARQSDAMDRRLASPQTASDDTGAPASSAPRHALIVEDNSVNALVAKAFFDDLGWSSTVVGTGREALAILAPDAIDETRNIDPETAQNRVGAQAAPPWPDAVLLDVRLPDCDGFHVLGMCRTAWANTSEQTDHKRHPLIIALTANAYPEDRARCLDAGFDAYFAKPFEPDALAELLATVREADVRVG
ncbi:MAG: ATP-binding protein [Pseudomonadota bacterium]